ncbi:MAG: hypothetical protein PHG00_09850 [Methylococcales bacterium]|nr:hypothetical protein [Methylococcales bacterium]
MVHGKTREEVDKQVQQIADLLGDFNQGCDVLYSTKILKKPVSEVVADSSHQVLATSRTYTLGT